MCKFIKLRHFLKMLYSTNILSQSIDLSNHMWYNNFTPCHRGYPLLIYSFWTYLWKCIIALNNASIYVKAVIPHNAYATRRESVFFLLRILNLRIYELIILKLRRFQRNSHIENRRACVCIAQAPQQLLINSTFQTVILL